MPNKKVIDIVADWLKENGYDGLVNVYLECGCELDDLIPCEMDFGDCRAGYKVFCPEGYEYDWVIAHKKNVKACDE